MSVEVLCSIVEQVWASNVLADSEATFSEAQGEDSAS